MSGAFGWEGDDCVAFEAQAPSGRPAEDHAPPRAGVAFDPSAADRQLRRLNVGPCRLNSDGLVSCEFLGLTLSSAFQPIVGAADREPHGFEALLRVRDPGGQSVPPVSLFDYASRVGEQRRLDRAARLIHVGNFYAQRSATSRLFLNVHGQHIEARDVSHGEFFAAALADQGLSADSIVIEILESDIENFDALGAAVESYKALGFGIAIDDFGARHSNFDRVWRLNPDYVKMDRSLVLEAATNPRARRVLPKIVEIVHDLEALVVCEGIEQSLHERIATDSGADFLQGFFYGQPAASI